MRRARTMRGLWTEPEGDGAETRRLRPRITSGARRGGTIPLLSPARPAARRLLVVPLLAAAIAMAAPVVASAQPTVAQAIKASCLHSPGASIALTKPVAAGDDLVL